MRDSLRRSRRKFEPNESVRLARREVVRARGGEEEEGEEERRRCFFVRRRAERERERVERSAVFERKTLNPREKKKSR